MATIKKKLQKILFGKINLTSISIILKKLKMLTLIGMLILDLKSKCSFRNIYNSSTLR